MGQSHKKMVSDEKNNKLSKELGLFIYIIRQEILRNS